MKITDEGLKDLSLTREPTFDENLNSYLIYEWKGVKYYASLIKPTNLAENQIYIEVNEEQFLSISKENTSAASMKNEAAIQNTNSQIKTVEGTSNLSILSQINSKYESALLVKYDQDQNSLLLEDIIGSVTPREGFKISLKHPSPFRIALQTQKPFHGSYSETEIVNQSLNQCGINSQNLWVTAFPIHENQQLIGMIIGLSNNKTHDIEDLAIFEGVQFFAKQMLQANSAAA